MSEQNAIRLLIQSQPLWQAHMMPVAVKTTYLVMGRRKGKWHTILSNETDLHLARRAMDAANRTGIFDRIVLSQGRFVANAPADHWQTIECALPLKVVMPPSDFSALIQGLQQKTANMPSDHGAFHATPIIAKKQSYTPFLAVAFVLAAIINHPYALLLVGALAICETIFLLDRRPIGMTRMATLNVWRNWFYALLNGALLLPIMLKYLV